MPIGSLSGPALASVLGRPGQWWPLQSKSHLWRPRPRRGAAAVAQPASSPPQETTAGEDSEDVGRRRKRQWRWGGGGWLPHRWSEGGLLRQWPGLALPVAVTPGFPPGARRNSQHSPPPAGRPPGSLVLGPQGSRFLGQPWSGKASLLTCPVSPPLGSSSR